MLTQTAQRKVKQKPNVKYRKERVHMYNRGNTTEITKQCTSLNPKPQENNNNRTSVTLRKNKENKNKK